jgi:Cytochrome c554 and c-prime
MPKTPLFCKVLLSLTTGFFIIFSGCWGTKDNDREVRSTADQIATPLRADAEQATPPAGSVKLTRQPPPQLLTPVKQTEPTPEIQDAAGPPNSATAYPRITNAPVSFIAMEPGARYGDQPVAGDLEPVNPLRASKQPAPAVTFESSFKPGEVPDAAAPQNTETPAPGKQIHPTNKLTDIPFDPIKENGKIFEGWGKPKVAIIITGVIEGYIEPCGCAGLDRMKGGMSRRFSLFKQLRDWGWPVVGLDVGGLASGFGREAEIKFQTMVEGMRKTGYDAIALGASDLRLPAGEIAAVTANLKGQQNPFVSANVALFSFDLGMTSTYRIISRGGMRIGVTAVLGKTYQQTIKNADIVMLDPVAAIQKILPEMKKQSDYLILLAHATKDETTALAKRFPDFNLIVTSDGEPEPPDKLHKFKDMKTLYVEVGHKGQNAVVLGFYDEPKKTVLYQRVPLDSRFPPSTEMKNLMAAYQDQLKALGYDGLGLRAAPQPQLESNGKFVGSAKCESCHEESYAIWKKSLHSKAYETLAKLDPPRNFDPECVSCHVVGWNPANFFQYQGGFESQEKTPKLTDVGCESCHGPGEKHVAAEAGSSEAMMQKYRKACVLTKADAKKSFCITCHDGDNSPDFNFETYWPLVEHYETSKPDANGAK